MIPSKMRRLFEDAHAKLRIFAGTTVSCDGLKNLSNLEALDEIDSGDTPAASASLRELPELGFSEAIFASTPIRGRCFGSTNKVS